jgi:hypothetical protein
MLTMDEARGIAARIWTRTNHRRKVMDPSLCEDIADVLVEEVAKNNIDDAKQNQKVADFERLKSGHEKLKEHYAEAQSEISKMKLNMANLQSEIDTLKLGKKDEVV